jgi:DNA-binding NarL/FixJ family response regulator
MPSQIVGEDDPGRAVRRIPVINPTRRMQPVDAPVARPPITEQLTARELEILGLISHGLFNREIAAHLVVSEETVKTHIHRLLAKMGARSRAHAVAIALRHRLVT